jgi:hypothetical protein
VAKIIRHVDVIWLEGDAIVAMFEVESTMSIYSGILRMTDRTKQSSTDFPANYPRPKSMLLKLLGVPTDACVGSCNLPP